MNQELFGYEVETVNIEFNKLFLLSDLHFGIRSNSIEWLNNYINFFREYYIPWLKENVEEGDALFILGDWFDNRQLLDILVMNVSIDIVEEMSKILPIYFITGNHDIYKKHDTDVHSLRAFKFIPNVYIYEKPVKIQDKDYSILLMPWIGNPKDEEKYAQANPADYLFSHADISGFQYDNGKEILKGADLANIEHFKRIISGHIHKRQYIKKNKGVYLGSPYATKRSDIGNVKGFYKFDPHNDKLNFQKNEYSPIFQKINLETILEKTLGECYELFSNNYSDIIIPDKYIHLFSLPKFIDLLKDCPYKKIEALGEKQNVNDEDVIIAQGENAKDIITLIEESILEIDKSRYELDSQSAEKLKELNKKYYKKIQEPKLEEESNE